MERTITINGTGSISVTPDRVVLTMTAQEKDKVYQKAVGRTAERIERLANALKPLGFGTDSLKTESFAVRSDYITRKDMKGNIRRLFDGFVCTHRLSLESDYCHELLSKTISIISSSLAEPNLEIAFTVGDRESVCEKLITQAARNARTRAQVLCEASGTTLGRLLTIDYNIRQFDVFSHIDFHLDNCLREPELGMCADMGIRPSAIDVSDSVTFIWELE